MVRSVFSVGSVEFHVSSIVLNFSAFCGACEVYRYYIRVLQNSETHSSLMDVIAECF